MEWIGGLLSSRSRLHGDTHRVVEPASDHLSKPDTNTTMKNGSTRTQTPPLAPLLHDLGSPFVPPRHVHGMTDGDGAATTDRRSVPLKLPTRKRCREEEEEQTNKTPFIRTSSALNPSIEVLPAFPTAPTLSEKMLALIDQRAAPLLSATTLMSSPSSNTNKRREGQASKVHKRQQLRSRFDPTRSLVKSRMASATAPLHRLCSNPSSIADVEPATNLHSTQYDHSTRFRDNEQRSPQRRALAVSSDLLLFSKPVSSSYLSPKADALTDVLVSQSVISSHFDQAKTSSIKQESDSNSPVHHLTHLNAAGSLDISEPINQTNLISLKAAPVPTSLQDSTTMQKNCSICGMSYEDADHSHCNDENEHSAFYPSNKLTSLAVPVPIDSPFQLFPGKPNSSHIVTSRADILLTAADSKKSDVLPQLLNFANQPSHSNSDVTCPVCGMSSEEVDHSSCTEDGPDIITSGVGEPSCVPSGDKTFFSFPLPASISTPSLNTINTPFKFNMHDQHSSTDQHLFRFASSSHGNSENGVQQAVFKFPTESAFSSWNRSSTLPCSASLSGSFSFPSSTFSSSSIVCDTSGNSTSFNSMQFQTGAFLNSDFTAANKETPKARQYARVNRKNR